MRKYYLYVFILILAGVVSCIKDDDSFYENTDELSVSEARDYFECFEPNITIGRSNINTKSNGKAIMPVWKESKAFKYKEMHGVETPLNTGTGAVYSFRDKQFADFVQKSTVTPPKNTIQKLVSVKTKDGHIINNIVWFNTANGSKFSDKQIENLSVDNLESFTGIVKCFDLSGKFINGLIFKHGKQIGEVKKGANSEVSMEQTVLPSTIKVIKTRSIEPNMLYDCFINYEFIYSCWGYYTANSSYSECNFEVNVDYYCFPSPGQGGGSGGSEPNKDDDYYIAIALDRICDGLKAETSHVRIVVDPNSPSPGRYDQYTLTITLDYAARNYVVLQEELFHAFQHKNYAHAIPGSGSPGNSNIEFEAKVFKDMTFLRLGENISSDLKKPHTIDINHSEFSNYINDLAFASAGNWQPLMNNYDKYLNLFKLNNPAYNTESEPSFKNFNAIKALKGISGGC